MRITVLGGCGAWPAAGQACSGYLVEAEGFRLLLDPGFATLPRLLERTTASAVDAVVVTVVVTHGHPDHCADLNPLLRARKLQDSPPLALPVHALPGAVDPVLALDRPETLAGAFVLHEVSPRRWFDIGPFRVETWSLPHFVPNVGLRLTSAGVALAYTGDTGPSPDVIELSKGAGVLLAEATFVDEVPPTSAPYLTSAHQAGRYAEQAGVGRLLLTHLWPGTDPEASKAAAAKSFGGPIGIATGGLVLDVSGAS